MKRNLMTWSVILFAGLFLSFLIPAKANGSIFVKRYQTVVVPCYNDAGKIIFLGTVCTNGVKESCTEISCDDFPIW